MNSKINKTNAQIELRKRKETLPTMRGGLLNPNFVYVNAANTDVRKTFAKAQAAIKKTTRVLDDMSSLIAWTPAARQYRRGAK